MKNAETKPTDPFSIKSMSKWNPKRALPTLGFRLQEFWARMRFESFEMPMVTPEATGDKIPSPALGETAVTDDQRKVFVACLKRTDHLTEPCVEIGSYRGETTRFIAQSTTRIVIAIDPFAGWGGAETDLKKFSSNTSGLPTVQHLRLTSGQAASHVSAASFVFIDAVHDYANVCFDLAAYAPKIVSGGVVALHDTDNPKFAGVRRAVSEFAAQTSEFSLLFHVYDLVAFQRH